MVEASGRKGRSSDWSPQAQAAVHTLVGVFAPLLEVFISALYSKFKNQNRSVMERTPHLPPY